MPDSFEPYEDMELHDAFVPSELFSEFITRMPQVCVDIVVETAEGILLAKRETHPPIWFWPGSRLYKGERLVEAAHRVAREELGIEISIHDRYGPYAHFWEDSAVDGSPSRHTVNPVFHVTPATPEYEIVLDDQHSDYRLITEVEADLHEYVRLYLTEIDFIEHSVGSGSFSSL